MGVERQDNEAKLSPDRLEKFMKHALGNKGAPYRRMGISHRPQDTKVSDEGVGDDGDAAWKLRGGPLHPPVHTQANASASASKFLRSDSLQDGGFDAASVPFKCEERVDDGAVPPQAHLGSP